MKKLVLVAIFLYGCLETGGDTGSGNGSGQTGEGTQVTCTGDDCICQDEAECDLTCTAGTTDCVATCYEGSRCNVDCNGAESCSVSCASAEGCAVDCDQALGCNVQCPSGGCAVSNCDLDLGCFVTCENGQDPFLEETAYTCP